MPAISIIVPVYKVEKYLHRCANSILAQTFTDFECILVDDCSPDNCPVICDEYAAKDVRFKVIHKKQNEGLPKARKSGLDMAIAELVTHIDSDDWIESNALELLYKKQQENDADIVVGSIKDIYQTSIVKHIPSAIPEGMLPAAYFLFYFHRSLCAKLYKKSLFSDYIVPDTNIGEDARVNIQVFIKIKYEKLQRIEDIIYNYDRTTSGMVISSRTNYRAYLDSPGIYADLWIEKYCYSVTQDNSIKAACLFTVYMSLICYLLNSRNCVTKSDINIFYKNYHQKFVNTKYHKMIRLRHKMIVPVFYFCFPLGRAYIKIFDFLRHIKSFLHLRRG